MLTDVAKNYGSLSMEITILVRYINLLLSAITEAMLRKMIEDAALSRMAYHDLLCLIVDFTPKKNERKIKR